MKYNLSKVFSNFQIGQSFINAVPYGSGHINDTYAVTCGEGNENHRYILQRVNHNVFKRPDCLMENIARVTTHIRNKLEAAGCEDIARRVLTLIPSKEGLDYYVDPESNYWRLYVFVEGAKTYDVMENLDQAYQAARTIGEFQNMLVDFPEPRLHDTIPDFHNGHKRFESFLKALKADAYDRAKEAKPEIEFLEKHAWIFGVLPKLVEEGKVPVRITHNDTKINNVMIDDRTNEGICVIDLDTVMPGLSLYDFGDITRTTVSPTAEDERDISKVDMRLPRFEAILNGYMSSAGDFLSKYEKDHLVFSGMMITLMIGTRFLTDHLSGDVYFKTHRQGHNLDRCRTQFKLVRSIIKNRDKMEKIVEVVK